MTVSEEEEEAACAAGFEAYRHPSTLIWDKLPKNDPHSSAIIAAGFAMALNAMGKEIDPKIPHIVSKMLEETKP